MNPIASSFVPSAQAQPSPTGLNDITVSTQTMFRALATEQEAHHRTLSKLQDAEVENKKMKQEVKSLVQAVNMLGTIIKHNQTRFNLVDAPATSAKQAAKPREPVSVKLETKPEPKPILYDVLARRKVEYAEQEESAPTESDSVSSTGTTKQVKSQAGEFDLFNLDLLKSPTSTDSTGAAAISSKLRKHFLLDSDSDDQLALTAGTTSKHTDESLLIQIIPGQVRQVAMQASALAQDLTTISTKPWRSNMAEMAAPRTDDYPGAAEVKASISPLH